MEKSVALWCESLFGFYTLKPIVEKYRYKNYKIFIYTVQENISIIENYIEKHSKTEIISIESLNTIPLRIINYIAREFLTNPSFSKMYSNHRKKDAFFGLKNILGYMIYVENKKINIFCYKLFSLFKNRLKSKFLISISRVRSNHLICSKEIKHVSVMESWDHPVKSPYWSNPNVILTWNKDLKKDYKKYQHFHGTKVHFIKPIKFRYIGERRNKSIGSLSEQLRNKDYISDIDVVKKKDYIMYITMTSSLNPSQHEGEMKLIDQLCWAASNLNENLYIKPKPNGPTGDYDIFKQKYSNVVVGTYASNPNSIDMLDEEYHTFRYLLLYYCKLVVNYGTTFVLEAALMDKPILQLNLSSRHYGKFGEYSNNVHIRKYLLGNNSVVINSKDDILEALGQDEGKQNDYLYDIKKWIHNQ